MDDAETPLFVRLPPKIAARLDRAAFELRLSKKELVTALLSRHMDDEAPEGADRLRQIHEEVEQFRSAAGLPHKKKMLIRFMDELESEPVRTPDGPSVGNVAFRSVEPAEVLTLEEAAELLQASDDDVLALADGGELPGRKVGGSWRFARAAVLRWLEHAPSA